MLRFLRSGDVQSVFARDDFEMGLNHGQTNRVDSQTRKSAISSMHT